MTRKAPGKFWREGVTLMELVDMFPDEAAATAWFESLVWPKGRHCPRCGNAETIEAKAPMPYWCGGCRHHFSVRVGTAMERSKVPLRKWAFAIYLEMTSIKGISSMKLHRDIGVTQKTAWFMLHRIREVWSDESAAVFAGPVEADEVYIGGREKNKHARKRLKAGRGAVGKTPVVGVRDRASGKVKAKVVDDTSGETLRGFVTGATAPDAVVYTDDARAYKGLARKHEAVKHSVGEYVRGMAHTQGIESFWALLRRGYHGTFHHISAKHLHRYVNQFAACHNIREEDTLDQMAAVVSGMVGKRLLYRDLTA